MNDHLDSVRNPDIEIVDISNPAGNDNPLGGPFDPVEPLIDGIERVMFEHLAEMNRPPQAPQTQTGADLRREPGSEGFTTTGYGNTTTTTNNATGTQTSNSFFGEGENTTIVSTTREPDLPGVAASPTTNTTNIFTQAGLVAALDSVTTPTGMTIWEDDLPATPNTNSGSGMDTSSSSAPRSESSTRSTENSDGSMTTTESTPDVPTSSSGPRSNVETTVDANGNETQAESVTTPTGTTIGQSTINNGSSDNDNASSNNTTSNNSTESDSNNSGESESNETSPQEARGV